MLYPQQRRVRRFTPCKQFSGFCEAPLNVSHCKAKRGRGWRDTNKEKRTKMDKNSYIHSPREVKTAQNREVVAVKDADNWIIVGTHQPHCSTAKHSKQPKAYWTHSSKENKHIFKMRKLTMVFTQSTRNNPSQWPYPLNKHLQLSKISMALVIALSSWVILAQYDTPGRSRFCSNSKRTWLIHATGANIFEYEINKHTSIAKAHICEVQDIV